MRMVDIPEVSQASRSEKIELANDILVSFGYPPLDEGGDSEISDEIKNTLDQRWAAYEKDPSIALNPEDAQEFVRKRLSFL